MPDNSVDRHLEMPAVRHSLAVVHLACHIVVASAAAAAAWAVDAVVRDSYLRHCPRRTYADLWASLAENTAGAARFPFVALVDSLFRLRYAFAPISAVCPVCHADRQWPAARYPKRVKYN